MKDRKDEGRVNIIAEIGEMPEQGQGELSSLLLKANFLLVESGGAILCQNPENNVYMLFLPLDTDGLTTDEFCVRLDAFLGKLDDFKEIVKSFHPLYQDSDEESEMNGFYLSNLG